MTIDLKRFLGLTDLGLGLLSPFHSAAGEGTIGMAAAAMHCGGGGMMMPGAVRAVRGHGATRCRN